MPETSMAQRAKRNADYLRKVFGTADLAEAKSKLESAIGGGGGGSLSDLQVAAGGDNERNPLESLDVLNEDPWGSSLKSGDLDRLEAIIHETGRPAYVIDNGSFIPNGQWDFLATGKIRKNIEAAIPSVGRIEVPKGFRPYAGTGFVVGDNLLMTNRHVAQIFASGVGTKMLKFDPGQIAGIDFLREVPAAGKPDPVFLEIVEVVMIHPYWDMALLRTKSPLPVQHQPLKLSTKTPQDLAGRNVVVIGYPAKDQRSNLKVQEEIFGGRYEIKRLMPGEHDGAVNYGGQDVMAHDTSTLGGASGSAVLDVESGEVVGLHFAGEYMKSNYAVPTVSLAEDSRIIDFGLRFEGTREAKKTFYQPYWDKADKNETVVIERHDENTAQEGSPPPDVTPLIGRFSFDSLEESEFHWNTAMSTVLASHIAYFDKVQARQTCDSWGLKNCHFIARDNTECFVAGDGNIAIVAFRGTETLLADWLTDLNAIGTTKTYGRVHRGFWAAFQGVADLLDAAIADLGAPTLVLTGHSLGGALAVIAAAEWLNKYRIGSIYTYGQPAAGKGYFTGFMQENFDNRFYRFVNDDDIVPMVPPLYHHTGQLYHFGPGNALTNRTESMFAGEETPTMTPEQFDRLRLALLQQRSVIGGREGETQEGLFPSFSDHTLARYISKISENAP